MPWVDIGSLLHIFSTAPAHLFWQDIFYRPQTICVSLFSVLLKTWESKSSLLQSFPGQLLAPHILVSQEVSKYPNSGKKDKWKIKLKKKKLLYKFACFKLWRTAQADQSRHFSHTVTGKYLLLCLTEKPKTSESKIYLLLIHHIQALSTASHFLHLRTANRLFITSHSFFFSL